MSKKRSGLAYQRRAYSYNYDFSNQVCPSITLAEIAEYGALPSPFNQYYGWVLKKDTTILECQTLTITTYEKTLYPTFFIIPLGLTLINRGKIINNGVFLSNGGQLINENTGIITNNYVRIILSPNQTVYSILVFISTVDPNIVSLLNKGIIINNSYFESNCTVINQNQIYNNSINSHLETGDISNFGIVDTTAVFDIRGTLTNNLTIKNHGNNAKLRLFESASFSNTTNGKFYNYGGGTVTNHTSSVVNGGNNNNANGLSTCGTGIIAGDQLAAWTAIVNGTACPI